MPVLLPSSQAPALYVLFSRSRRRLGALERSDSSVTSRAGGDGVTQAELEKRYAEACVEIVERYAPRFVSWHETAKTDLRSHEPPRNSGEGDAVHGPTPLGEKPERHSTA